MSPSSLTPLQWRILEVLFADLVGWTLTGGAALAGFYLGHRTTRDLDLFRRGEPRLEHHPSGVAATLARAGLSVETLQTAETFHRFRVSEEGDTCIVDLVAEPAAPVEPPATLPLGAVGVSVDTPHEILVSKLCALLSRSELRDLWDVQALLDAGGNLTKAIADAPRKDAGFSALTLAWVLEQLPVDSMAAALQLPSTLAGELHAFKEHLIHDLLADAAPDSDSS